MRFVCDLIQTTDFFQCIGLNVGINCSVVVTAPLLKLDGYLLNGTSTQLLETQLKLLFTPVVDELFSEAISNEEYSLSISRINTGFSTVTLVVPQRFLNLFSNDVSQAALTSALASRFNVSGTSIFDLTVCCTQNLDSFC